MNMKNWLIRIIIDVCCKYALKYELRLNMLLKQEDLKYIYAVGSNVIQRDKWLKRVVKLQNSINKKECELNILNNLKDKYKDTLY